MNGGECIVKDCAAKAEGEDLFCQAHWRKLPRWARVELVRLRNAARKRAKGAANVYAKAAVVAAKLATDAQAAPPA